MSAGSAWLVVPLSVLPLVVLCAAGAGTQWLAAGAVAWAIAVAVKIPLLTGLQMVPAPAWLHGLLAGILSSTAELGIALLALTRSRDIPSVLDLLLFAGAAGSVEALVVLGWGAAARTPPELVARWTNGAATSRVIRHQVLLERAVAWGGHLGSRSLVGLAFVRQLPVLGLLAAMTFAATDGVAAYWHERGVDWSAPEVLTRYLKFALVLVLLELAVLAGYLALTAGG